MDKKIETQYRPDYVSPPGETLAELLTRRGMSQKEFAERMERTTKYVNEVIKGKARIKTDAAILFERVLGIPSSFWNNRQRAYDDYCARVREDKALTKHIEWAKAFPYRDMCKRGWVPRTRNEKDKLRNLLDFFGVASPTAFDDIWRCVGVAYRKPTSVRACEHSLAAWLRKGEIISSEVDCEPYDQKRFLECLTEIRGMTTSEPEAFVPRLKETCASCGVVVAFVPELPKTASGATRWLTPEKALIQLSLRYKTDDHLWFTFFHEAAHIIYHPKKQIFIENKGNDSPEETRANRFARDFLIPMEEYRRFVKSHPDRDFSKTNIRKFACELGIAPGIVVGRLQNEGLLTWNTDCNHLKNHFVWTSASTQ